MNIRRGLWRLWIVLSLFWIVSVGMVHRPDTSAWRFWNASAGRSADPAVIEAADPRNGGTHYVVQWADGRTFKVTPPTGRSITEHGPLESTEAPAIEGLDEDWALALAVARAHVVRAAQRRLSIDDLKAFALMAFVPPVVVLGIGSAFVWALRGFRPT